MHDCPRAIDCSYCRPRLNMRPGYWYSNIACNCHLRSGNNTFIPLNPPKRPAPSQNAKKANPPKPPAPSPNANKANPPKAIDCSYCRPRLNMRPGYWYSNIACNCHSRSGNNTFIPLNPPKRPSPSPNAKKANPPKPPSPSPNAKKANPPKPPSPSPNDQKADSSNSTYVLCSKKEDGNPGIQFVVSGNQVSGNKGDQNGKFLVGYNKEIFYSPILNFIVQNGNHGWDNGETKTDGEIETYWDDEEETDGEEPTGGGEET
ncbi:hypothetical protein M0R45_035138 [Rubus argutus]|uniref:Uncharacterized protein n=1 Tax=Rubus argutus TaxID=59490 RepID=A0AAW1VW10_RUBAR